MPDEGTPVCPHCFAEYEVGDDFCPKCGKPVGDATSTMPFIPPPGEDFEEPSSDSEKPPADKEP